MFQPYKHMPGQQSWMSIRLLIQWSSCQAPLEVTFFAAVKSFHANIAIIKILCFPITDISVSFVSNVKNSIHYVCGAGWLRVQIVKAIAMT